MRSPKIHRLRPNQALSAAVAVGLVLGLLQVATAPPSAAMSYAQSQNIAMVPNASGRTDNGGTLPTSGFPGYTPSFTNVTPEAIRDDAADPLLAGFDTVVLNGICDIATFLGNSQFKSRVEGFASNGGKLIIWDSECTSTDYTLFEIPFMTSNPGAAGAQGTLTDTEENTLSSSDPASPYYVDVDAVATQTDAVGDANVFTTFDPRWYSDLDATNVLGVNGPVQAYANLGSGLVIYSGLDKDYLPGYTFEPTATDGASHLARIWMLELLQPWDPDNLPHDNPVVGFEGRYVAIGDSYSAGEGNPPFIDGTDQPSGSLEERDECHRSKAAYGPILKDELGVDDSNFEFHACSGAILAHISESVGGLGQWDGLPQLDAIAPFDAPSLDTSLVTLTIGGNDVGFADALTSCIRGFGSNQIFHGDCRKTLTKVSDPGLALLRNGGTIQIDRRDGSWKCRYDKRKKTCKVGAQFPTGKYFVTREVASLSGMFGKIRDRAPNATIVVPLYPHLFPTDPPERCIVGQAMGRLGTVHSYTLDRDAMIRMNQLADDLDGKIIDSVAAARSQGIDVEFVETRDAFYGHGVECIDDPGAPDEPWINGLIFEDATVLTVSPSPFSFHPNNEGHRQFASLILLALDGA